MSHGLTWTPHWWFIRIYGGKLLAVCHQPDKSCDHEHWDNGEILFLICHVTSRELCLKGYVNLWLARSFRTTDDAIFFVCILILECYSKDFLLSIVGIGTCAHSFEYFQVQFDLFSEKRSLCLWKMVKFRGRLLKNRSSSTLRLFSSLTNLSLLFMLKIFPGYCFFEGRY